jgi:hypothetical protein
MNTSATNLRPLSARHARGWIIIKVSDGSTARFRCAKNEYLAKATARERGTIEVSPMGLHWPLLDEDLSLEGILAGRHGRPLGHGGKRRGAGRKPSGREPVTLRLKPQARRALERRAHREGRTLSATLEALLLP